MTVPFMQKAARVLLRLFPFALPLYVLRFSLVGLPTTVLEVYVGFFLFACTFAYGFAVWRKGWERLGGWRWPVVAWFAVTLVAVFVAPDLYAGFGLWRAYALEPLLVFVAAAGIFTEEDRKALERNFFWLAIALGVYAFVQFLTGIGIPHPWNVGILEGRRAVGPFPYPNALALLVTPLAAWAFARWLGKRQTTNYQLQTLFAWFLGLLAILLAKSDGGLVAFGLVAWILLFLQKRTRLFLIGLTVIGLLVLMLVPRIGQPVFRELTFQGWSGQVRLFQWRETREMLRDHWFFGAGLGGYPVVFQPYHKARAIEIFQYPHNIVLNFWTETGLLGLIVFGWIVVTWMRASRRHPERSEGSPRPGRDGKFSVSASDSVQDGAFTWVPLLTYLIHGLVDVPYFKNDLALAFWLTALVCTVGNSPSPSFIKRGDQNPDRDTPFQDPSRQKTAE